jgi:hypothetical protein
LKANETIDAATIGGPKRRQPKAKAAKAVGSKSMK